MFPYKEDLFRFDFEVDAEDEYMCRSIEKNFVQSLLGESQNTSEK
jgi:hypothetical protein